MRRTFPLLALVCVAALAVIVSLPAHAMADGLFLPVVLRLSDGATPTTRPAATSTRTATRTRTPTPTRTSTPTSTMTPAPTLTLTPSLTPSPTIDTAPTLIALDNGNDHDGYRSCLPYNAAGPGDQWAIVFDLESPFCVERVDAMLYSGLGLGGSWRGRANVYAVDSPEPAMSPTPIATSATLDFYSPFSRINAQFPIEPTRVVSGTVLVAVENRRDLWGDDAPCLTHDTTGAIPSDVSWVNRGDGWQEHYTFYASVTPVPGYPMIRVYGHYCP